MSLGIIVHGSNHFIVRGPLPTRNCARELVRRWELPQIGAPPVPALWRISTKEFREDLEWAIEFAGETGIQENVRQLLDGLAARGVIVHRGNGPFLPQDDEADWPGKPWPAE